jgi:hypothetical protein
VVDRVLLRRLQGLGVGASRAPLKAAIDYPRSQGATLLEAYLVDKPERSRADFKWFGAKTM